jgi:capsular polysaccharide biosynthesis protein
MTLEKQLLSDISFGSATTVISAESKLQEPYKIEGTAAFLAPSIWGNGNYCRWMLNNLPRVNLLSECGVEVNSIDKFIFYDLDLSFHKETLENLRIPFDKIIKTCDHTYIEVDNLIVPSTLSHPAHKGSDWVFEFLKRLFLQESREVKTKSRRLYIHRKKGRRGIVNEEELLSFLSKYDFQVVNPGTMSVQDQAILFSTAEIVIAPHGAGLTNLAFCRAKTKIIEIFSPLYGTPAYWILASKANLDYYYLIGKDYDKSLELNTSKKGMWTHQMKDIYVDLENLLSLIQYIGL